jgi:glycosyltransferase involved in cell wall biosynthesis
LIRVGVDAWNLPGDHRGIGRYLRCILREWNEHFRDRVQTTLIVPEWHTWTVRSRYRREVGGVPYPIVSRAFHRYAPLDVLWFPWNGCSWTDFSKPAVATLHDASNFVVAGYAPQTQAIFRNATTHCRALITDSVFSQHELARELDLSPERLTPVLLGVDTPSAPNALPQSLADGRPYVLFVGQSEKRKGIEALLRAFADVRAQLPRMSLVLAGSRGDAMTGDAPPGVIELGFVDDATLSALYANAAMFAFPSRYEGFGLPLLEAMAHGTPVIAARSSAIPEVTGNAAHLVATDDVRALAEGMLRIATDDSYAAQLREQGRGRAALFTWRNTAARTLDVLSAAAS